VVLHAMLYLITIINALQWLAAVSRPVLLEKQVISKSRKVSPTVLAKKVVSNVRFIMLNAVILFASVDRVAVPCLKKFLDVSISNGLKRFTNNSHSVSARSSPWPS